MHYMYVHVQASLVHFSFVDGLADLCFGFGAKVIESLKIFAKENIPLDEQ